jgi:hypothetical protein
LSETLLYEEFRSKKKKVVKFFRMPRQEFYSSATNVDQIYVKFKQSLTVKANELKKCQIDEINKTKVQVKEL